MHLASYPSGQRDLTVNQPAQPSGVRIPHLPQNPTPPGRGFLLPTIVALLLHSIYATYMGRKSKAEEERVANRLEEVRAQSGLSRQELADQVEVHYQTIGYIERGEYSPSLVLALRIASILKVRVEEIFWLDEEST